MINDQQETKQTEEETKQTEEETKQTEEERLIMKMGESALLKISCGKKKTTKFQANQKRNGKIPPQTDIKKVTKCFFCKKNGYMKKNCPK